jgi:hypothetical protein
MNALAWMGLKVRSVVALLLGHTNAVGCVGGQDGHGWAFFAKY